jgi:hypothetical protein
MKIFRFLVAFVLVFLLANFFCCDKTGVVWLNAGGKTIAKRFPPPSGFKRVVFPEGSFQAWLQALPLKDGCPHIRLYDGSELLYLDWHCAVVDMDIGNQDLQQCADTIIRLRAEYLWKMKRYDELHFNFTSGDRSAWLKWRDGLRPYVRGNDVKFVKTAKYDESYNNFRRWLDSAFKYAGTISISRDFPKLKDTSKIRPGDFFVEAGTPGHAVIIVDIAVNKTTGEKVMLLGQGFMPAQEMHILKNPGSDDLSPWYSMNFGPVLETPQWNFYAKHLRRLPD